MGDKSQHDINPFIPNNMEIESPPDIVENEPYLVVEEMKDPINIIEEFKDEVAEFINPNTLDSNENENSV